jgi:hypothetical protein
MNTHQQIHQIAASDRRLEQVMEIVPNRSTKDANHLQRRQQQRAISNDMIKIALAYGQKQYDNRGGIIYMLGDRALSNTPYARFIDCLRGLCVICRSESQAMVTTFWRYGY